MNVALVHEWLESYAGSERVVEQLLKALPMADLYALVDFLPNRDRTILQGKRAHTSFIQHLPLARKHFRNYLPLMPAAIEQFDLSSYDIVVSSNHAFAKGVITRADQMHVSYVHTPIRYAWDLQHAYLRQAGLRWGLKNLFVRATLHYLRNWDRISSDRVDAFVANSHYIAQRIRKIYRRPAFVIYPPVDIDSFTLESAKDDFYLAASRMVPYKRIDLIVEAFARMPERQLIVIGDGPEFEKIASKATANVKLLGYQPFDVLLDHMQRARAFVFAADEDFGIMPVEAQACGTPVIAFGRGGALETVVNGRTGLFFEQQSARCIQEAVEAFDSVRGRMNPELIRANAERFAPSRFRREVLDLMDWLWRRFCKYQRSYLGAAVSDSPFPLDQIGLPPATPSRVVSRRVYGARPSSNRVVRREAIPKKAVPETSLAHAQDDRFIVTFRCTCVGFVTSPQEAYRAIAQQGAEQCGR